jgi:hypothetical protein
MFMLLLLLNLHQQGNFKWPSILFVIFFWGVAKLGFELMLAGQVLYHFSHSTSDLSF